MDLLTKQTIQPASKNQTVFRISPWGSLFTLVFLLIGLLVGMMLFVHSYQASITWGMVLSGIYSLLMFGLCRILFRAFRSACSSANWLARIDRNGILLKYRSYLHDDSPAEDMIALQLSWREIREVQLQRELYTTTDIDQARQNKLWFLAIKLNPRYLDIERIKAALELEKQRKPLHLKVNDLKHELFIARKNKAADAEILRLKNDIALEKQRYPGKHRNWRFHDSPVVFSKPDLLKVAWSHITPGKKKLRQLLAQYTTVIRDQQQHFEIDKPMTETEFKALLATLISRDEKLEAIKLVRLQKGLDITAAKAFIENTIGG